MHDRLARLGIQARYLNATGEGREAPPESVERVVAALKSERPYHVPRFVYAGAAGRLPGVTEIITEDGRTVACTGALPNDVPLGYHQAIDTRGRSRLLVVAPRACALPQRRSFGIAAQLYAARSRRSWGIGDLSDLRTLTSWAAQLGAGHVLVNPLHAPLPVVPQEPSPYAPSSRRYRNPLYIDVERVAGVETVSDALRAARAQARALLDRRVIDRDAVFRLKMNVLAELFEQRPDDRALDGYIANEPGVQRYATFCALVEQHGATWRSWPERLRNPAGAAVEQFRRDHEQRVRFHAWLQLILDTQLADAAAGASIVHDLAVGLDPRGADAWEWQDAIVDGFAIGAPPDEFNTLGQNWLLAPFHPHRLRAQGYRPFIETIRAMLRHAGGLRIDHVMALFRLYWIPDGCGADSGVYVRYPHKELLDILALESVRAGAFIAGEDLGTVERATRAELSRRNVLSYRLLWFESEDPARYPRKALAGVNTHDLPTIAGLWDGSDVEEQRAAGLQPNEPALRAILERVREAIGLDASADVDDVVVAVHALIARAPSLVVAATLDDMLAVRERPNLPGADGHRHNWSLALPMPLEDAMTATLPARVASVLRGG